MSLMFPKGTTQRKRIHAVRRKRKSIDAAGSAEVRERSNGACEDCDRQRAVHVHHEMGGHGVRGRGESALASRKRHLCTACHARAHGR